MKIIDITFHANTEYTNTSAMLAAQATSFIYIDPMKKMADVDVIKHYTGSIEIHQKPGYHFFNARNRFGYFSFRTMRYIKKEQPDIIVVQGLIFPVQVLALRLWMGGAVKILVRHHADRPFSRPKRILQQMADKCINGYFFTSIGNAKEWLNTNIIQQKEKIFELPATLTKFEKLDKVTSRQKVNMPPGFNYLLVGRLNDNKDPLTTLNAFEKLLIAGHNATLHLIFQTDELLSAVKRRITASALLQDHVLLHGRVAYHDLQFWFSAADHYISSSLSEGGSSAILEAMSCGCVPIVSNIPASMNVIGEGAYGLYFNPGDADALYEQLVKAITGAGPSSSVVRAHYQETFSPEAIANRFTSICKALY